MDKEKRLITRYVLCGIGIYVWQVVYLAIL